MIRISSSVHLRLITFNPPKLGHTMPVLFVAGWVSQIEGWIDVLTEMTKDHVVYYIETREKNSSVLQKRAKFDITAIGDDIVMLVDQLKLKADRYVLFGSSLGATVILDCFSRLKSKPRCLILIGPNAEFRIPWFWKCVIIAFYPPLYFLLKPVIKWYLKHFRLNVQKDRSQYEKYARALDAADPWKLKGAAIPFSKYKVWDALTKIHAPTLIIGGSQDKLHEPESLKRLVEMLPQSEYVDLETNRRTHTAEVVHSMKKLISAIQ